MSKQLRNVAFSDPRCSCTKLYICLDISQRLEVRSRPSHPSISSRSRTRFTGTKQCWYARLLVITHCRTSSRITKQAPMPKTPETEGAATPPCWNSVDVCVCVTAVRGKGSLKRSIARNASMSSSRYRDTVKIPTNSFIHWRKTLSSTCSSTYSSTNCIHFTGSRLDAANMSSQPRWSQ